MSSPLPSPSSSPNPDLRHLPLIPLRLPIQQHDRKEIETALKAAPNRNEEVEIILRFTVQQLDALEEYVRGVREGCAGREKKEEENESGNEGLRLLGRQGLWTPEGMR